MGTNFRPIYCKSYRDNFKNILFLKLHEKFFIITGVGSSFPCNVLVDVGIFPS
jgi:hypothetical protein